MADDDMFDAISRPVAYRLESDRWLIIGPSRFGQLLEIVILDPTTDEPAIIHAMPLRTRFRRAVIPRE